MIKIDWPLLRLPLILLLIAIVVAVVLLSWSSAYSDKEDIALMRADQEFNQAMRRYNEARRDKALYRQYLESYELYLKRGIIGEEQRLSWIEELQAINKDLRLPSLRYEISPQDKAVIQGLRVPGSIAVNASEMRLTVGLLHEGDMFTLLRTLKQNASGFYALKNCDLTSKLTNTVTPEYRPGTAYVDMACTLDWYTVAINS